MTKILHYIKEDHSGDAERFCLDTYKRDYPDFKFMAWKPGSSPLRILYDNGGLFVGPYVYSRKRIPDSFFEKDFLVFDNSFESQLVNLNLCCYAEAPKSPVFLEFMEKGVMPTLKEKGFKNDFKVGLNKEKQSLDEIDILPSPEFSGLERKSYDIYDSYLFDMNFNLNKADGFNLHYLTIDEDSSPNKVFSTLENYVNLKVEGKTKHFLLLVCKGNYDLTNRMCVYLQYHCILENKRWDIIFGDGDTDKLITEYVGRRFNNLVSCEKLSI